MINILLVDDNKENLKVLELYIEDYMEDNEFDDFNTITTTDPKEGLEIINNQDIDIIFLDIMMPKMDGFEFLKIVRNNQNMKKQLIVVMATALGDKETIKKEKQYGANAYMVKPVKSTTVDIVLKRYLDMIKNKQNNDTQEENFDEFEDFDDFDDFDDNGTAQETELEALVHKSYTHLSAVDFMEEYNYNIETINNKLEDLDELIFNVFESADDQLELSLEVENIVDIFENFHAFLLGFEELEDLETILEILLDTIKSIKTEQLTQKQQTNIGKFIKTIVFDLIEFKEQVFIKQNVENIYYLNASIASSCVQIEYILENI